MNLDFENMFERPKKRVDGFSLAEVMASVVILGLVCTGVMTVINRNAAKAADLVLKSAAFNVARENMEQMLCSYAVEEMVEYGYDDFYPDIQWQKSVETFYEPVTSRMWVRGVCSAEYRDSSGELQTIELSSWLNGLTKEQLLKIANRKKREADEFADNSIEDIEEAAEYADVDEETVRQWVENGMPLDDGQFDKRWLDLYERSAGEPSPEAVVKVEDEIRIAAIGFDPGGSDGGDDSPVDVYDDDGPPPLPPNATMEEILEYIRKYMVL